MSSEGAIYCNPFLIENLKIWKIDWKIVKFTFFRFFHFSNFQILGFFKFFPQWKIFWEQIFFMIKYVTIMYLWYPWNHLEHSECHQNGSERNVNLKIWYFFTIYVNFISFHDFPMKSYSSFLITESWWMFIWPF